MLEQRQNLLLNYFKTVSVGPARNRIWASRTVDWHLTVRLTRYFEPYLAHKREAPSGFRRGRLINIMMFELHQLIEKCLEKHQQLHIIFAVTIIKSFLEGIKARIFISGKLTQPFEVSSGLYLGCILTPVLFILFLNMCFLRPSSP